MEKKAIKNGSKVLVFDNYDSFTYNLVHLLEKILHEKVTVVRNDEIALDEVDYFDKIILSPGPGIPKEAGLLLPLLKKYIPSKSILGVCLGHQAIAEALGGTLINLDDVFHGIATQVQVIDRAENGKDIFKNVPNIFEAGRYHSWIVHEETLPKQLIVTAKDKHNLIMAFRHTIFPVYGVQFHPESILTPCGEQIIRNWISN